MVLDGEEVVYDPVRRDGPPPEPDRIAAARPGATAAPASTSSSPSCRGLRRRARAIRARRGRRPGDFEVRRLVGPEPSPDDVVPVARPQPELAPRSEPLAFPERVGRRDHSRWSSPPEPRCGCAPTSRRRPLRRADLRLPSSPSAPGPTPPRAGAGEHLFDVVTGGAGPIRLLLDGDEVGAATHARLGACPTCSGASTSWRSTRPTRPRAAARLGGPRDGTGWRCSRPSRTPASRRSPPGWSGPGSATSPTRPWPRPGHRRIRAYPKPISLDPGSWALFADSDPSSPTRTSLSSSTSGTLDPSAAAPRRARTSRPGARRQVGPGWRSLPSPATSAGVDHPPGADEPGRGPARCCSRTPSTWPRSRGRRAGGAGRDRPRRPRWSGSPSGTSTRPSI